MGSGCIARVGGLGAPLCPMGWIWGPLLAVVFGGGVGGGDPLCALWGFGVPFGGSLGSSMGSLGSPIRPILGSPMGRRGRGLQWWLGVVVLHPPPPFTLWDNYGRGSVGGAPLCPMGSSPNPNGLGGWGSWGTLLGGLGVAHCSLWGLWVPLQQRKGSGGPRLCSGGRGGIWSPSHRCAS